MIQLSLVPNFEGKITARNVTKGVDVELRRLPPLELQISLTTAYPSAVAPNIKVLSQFYAPYESLIQDLLREKWYEGSMGVLYDYSQFIQDELLENLEIKCAKRDKKQMRFEFPREADFIVFVTESQRSFKRQFDNEEHLCGICKRHLLGEKFFFLSGCEHFFCFECMQELVEFKMKNG